MSTTKIIEYIKNELDLKTMLLLIDRDGTIILNNDFFGKNKNWPDEIAYNNEVISFISYLQTKYRTTKIVVTNQAGVARKLFSCKIVEDINKAVDLELQSKGIKIGDWEYCPSVDAAYTLKYPELDFDINFVSEKTKRKPSTDMVTDGLEKIGKDITDFEIVLVIGDQKVDELLAKNLNAVFINVNNRKYSELLSQLENISF